MPINRETTSRNLKALDSYESWLEKQPAKDVEAKSGFIAEKKIEEE